jgi:hypothetical protein
MGLLGTFDSQLYVRRALMVAAMAGRVDKETRAADYAIRRGPSGVTNWAKRDPRRAHD